MTEAHAVARLCRASPAQALALLGRAEGMARWCLGLWHTREVAPGLLAGNSLFGGGNGLARVQVDTARGVVDYAVGSDAGDLQPRIQARVQPGPELGYDAGTCVVTLSAWRTAAMDDARWQRLKATHDVEIEIIRGELERDAGGGVVA